jgi:hypothetical protein
MFDLCESTGGNDEEGWNGGVASVSITNQFDSTGWTFEKGSEANGCVKLGTGKALGSATTPALGTAGNYSLTFRAAAWDGSSELLTLHLSVTGGGTLDEDSVTLDKGAWNTYSVTLSGATAATKVTFSGSSGNNRFFLDDVTAIPTTTHAVPAENLSVSGTTCAATGLSPETTYTFTVTASATVDGDTVTSSASADETTAVPPPPTALIVF